MEKKIILELPIMDAIHIETILKRKIEDMIELRNSCLENGKAVSSLMEESIEKKVRMLEAIKESIDNYGL